MLSKCLSYAKKAKSAKRNGHQNDALREDHKIFHLISLAFHTRALLAHSTSFMTPTSCITSPGSYLRPKCYL